MATTKTFDADQKRRSVAIIDALADLGLLPRYCQKATIALTLSNGQVTACTLAGTVSGHTTSGSIKEPWNQANWEPA